MDLKAAMLPEIPKANTSLVRVFYLHICEEVTMSPLRQHVLDVLSYLSLG